MTRAHKFVFNTLQITYFLISENSDMTTIHDYQAKVLFISTNEKTAEKYQSS